MRAGREPTVDRIDVHCFRIPTDGPEGHESDGTLSWDSTTAVVVQLHSGEYTGTGYTYADVSVATFIRSVLSPVVHSSDAMNPATVWQRMHAAVRNAGRPGVGMMAISAVDIALWDLKAAILDLPLFAILPAFHFGVPIYGSGGFTNYPLPRLAEQVGAWVEAGIPRVKVKTSRHPADDPARLDVVREHIGPGTELYVDANGALDAKEAVAWAHRFRDGWNARWFEEPVSSYDARGLRTVREQGPPGLDIAAGEYAYVLPDFTALLESVDCLQADVTRCGGITGILQVAGLASAHELDLSAHCAPAVSAHAFCAVRRLRHLEYFHDHVRVEDILFDGTLRPYAGELRPDRERPGLGLTVKWADAEKYRVPVP